MVATGLQFFKAFSDLSRTAALGFEEIGTIGERPF